ncbi:hypothetical protein K438DRAFT_408754 [Mycena galopus ATCC 62051]|nr:hypothetical protein K438DRAFT_408754 [Mycena galopus ATCC 62051]
MHLFLPCTYTLESSPFEKTPMIHPLPASKDQTPAPKSKAKAKNTMHFEGRAAPAPVLYRMHAHHVATSQGCMYSSFLAPPPSPFHTPFSASPAQNYSLI